MVIPFLKMEQLATWTDLDLTDMDGVMHVYTIDEELYGEPMEDLVRRWS